MADTTTPNYGWTQPAVGGDPSTWGTLLNADLAAIDQQVHINAQAGVPIGTLVMFGGATPPANWLACNGQSLSTAAPYDKLFAVIGYAYGGSGANFNLPNFIGLFPTGAYASINPIGKTGGSNTATLAVANLPAHNHGVSDPGHTHGVNQSAHTHVINDPGHNHGINDPQHSHTLPGTSGGGLGVASPPHVYSDASGGGAIATNLAPTGISVAVAGTGLTNAIQPQNANVSINTAPTGVTTTNTGSGTPVSTVPPWLAVTFCIRYQ